MNRHERGSREIAKTCFRDAGNLEGLISCMKDRWDDNVQWNAAIYREGSTEVTRYTRFMRFETTFKDDFTVDIWDSPQPQKNKLPVFWNSTFGNI